MRNYVIRKIIIKYQPTIKSRYHYFLCPYLMGCCVKYIVIFCRVILKCDNFRLIYLNKYLVPNILQSLQLRSRFFFIKKLTSYCSLWPLYAMVSLKLFLLFHYSVFLYFRVDNVRCNRKQVGPLTSSEKLNNLCFIEHCFILQKKIFTFQY